MAYRLMVVLPKKYKKKVYDLRKQRRLTTAELIESLIAKE